MTRRGTPGERTGASCAAAAVARRNKIAHPRMSESSLSKACEFSTTARGTATGARRRSGRPRPVRCVRRSRPRDSTGRRLHANLSPRAHRARFAGRRSRRSPSSVPASSQMRGRTARLERRTISRIDRSCHHTEGDSTASLPNTRGYTGPPPARPARRAKSRRLRCARPCGWCGIRGR